MEQAWVSEERGWRLRWGGKWAERSLQEGIRELGRGRGDDCRLMQGCGVRAGRGSTWAEPRTGLCERRGPSVSQGHTQPRGLFWAEAGRKATLHSWTQRHNSLPQPSPPDKAGRSQRG